MPYAITKVRSYGDTNEFRTENTDFQGVVATIRLYMLLSSPKGYVHGPIRLSIAMAGELLQVPSAVRSLQGEHLQGDYDW